MTDEKKEIRTILLGKTVPDGNGKLTSAARGEIRLPIGVGDGAGAVRFFGVARKAVRYETELGEEKALAAAELTMRDIGRGLSLREQPDAAACLIRYVITRPAVLTFRFVEGAPVLTAWTGRGLTGWISLRRALSAFRQAAPDKLRPTGGEAPEEREEEKEKKKDRPGAGGAPKSGGRRVKSKGSRVRKKGRHEK